MESTERMKKLSSKSISLFLSLTFSAVLVSLLLNNSPSSSPSLSSPLHSFIKKDSSDALYTTFSNTTTFLNHIIQFAVNRTANHASNARMNIAAHFKNQDLNTQEKNALQDCMEMLDMTLYELERAMDELGSFPSSYGNIKTLLSAAMTNGYTCVDGFFYLEKLDLDDRKGNSQHLQNLLTPISDMISNTLALIKHVENTRFQEIIKKPKMMVGLASVGRRKTKKMMGLRPNVIVATDGSGNYTFIREAIAVAPNMSKTAYIIKIKAGVYKENVVIPREKLNVMLVGDGMNRTIITGSRNFVDGFSTFESATLTVMGDKFLARDLTIENTSGPEKHQAVALLVTSNAAFSRCEIVSHQDTLYAHSLRQFYHDCVIQGTVDFIFGNAAAVFQNSLILARKPITGQRNTITAQGREDPNQNTGISLQNCTIEAAKEFNLIERKNFSTYLGRPWRNYSRTIVVNSYLGDLIHPRGWLEWNEYSGSDTVEYIEYMNSGPGADTRRRISWGGYRNNCTEDVVKQFQVEEFLHGGDGWLESTILPLFRSS